MAWKLKETKSPKLPMRLPFHNEPMDCAASSTTRSLWRLAMSYSLSLSTGKAGKIDRDDGLGARRDGSFDLVQVDVARDRVDVRKHRRCADFKDDAGCRHPGNRRGDDFVAGADARNAQGDFHGAGAGVEGTHRAPAEIGRELFFEFRDFGAAGDPAGAQHVADGGNGGFVDEGFGEG